MKKGVVKKGQIWKSKGSKTLVKITGKASGNNHWIAEQLTGVKSHHIHEGTLQRFYELIK